MGIDSEKKMGTEPKKGGFIERKLSDLQSVSQGTRPLSHDIAQWVETRPSFHWTGSILSEPGWWDHPHGGRRNQPWNWKTHMFQASLTLASWDMKENISQIYPTIMLPSGKLT